MTYEKFLQALEELLETRDVTPFVDEQGRICLLYSGHQLTPLSAVCFYKKLDLMDSRLLAEIARDLELQAQDLRHIHKATENRQSPQSQVARTDILTTLRLWPEYR